MASNEQRFERLYERLNMLSESEPTNKQNLNELESFLNKTYEKYTDNACADEQKIRKLMDQCKYIELTVKQYTQMLKNQQDNGKEKLERYRRKAQKTIEKVSRQRKQVEKNINSVLENYLIELSSAKTKSNNTCKFAIKQFIELEEELQAMDDSIESEQVTANQINKKIYLQFSAQIDEISQLISEQRKNRQQQEAAIVNQIESLYKRVHANIQKVKKDRVKREEETIDFLEKVIEKVQHELKRL